MSPPHTLLAGLMTITLVRAGSTFAALPLEAQDPKLIPHREPHSSVVYDSRRGVFVLFGRSFKGETWEWDGQGWRLRGTGGPSGRLYFTMAFDSARGITVLYGGHLGTRGYDAPTGDTWEWDGAAWSLRDQTGPAPRCCHNMVFDEARGVTLLFGGHVASGELLGDTWEWDGARWSFRSDSGPTPRVAHAMAYDAARGLVWLSGGIDRRGIDTFQTGTWSWDGWSWTLAPASDPPPHFGSELFFDVRRRTLALVGGWGPLDVPLNEIMEWDGTVWNRSPIPSLPKIEGSAQIIYDSRADQPLLFAMTKRDAPIPAEVWRLGDSQWTKTQTAELSTRD